MKWAMLPLVQLPYHEESLQVQAHCTIPSLRVMTKESSRTKQYVASVVRLYRIVHSTVQCSAELRFISNGSETDRRM